MFSFIIMLTLDVGKVIISPLKKGSSGERLMRKMGVKNEDLNKDHEFIFMN